MPETRYPLAVSTWDEAEQAAIHRVMRKGFYTMGEEVRKFEAAAAAWFGSRFAVMVNSGSSANLLMIAAMTLRKRNPLLAGDEVIVPAVSWSTTYYPVTQYGLNLRFVDIDPQTLNLDPALVEQAITPRTRAILAVNLLGNPCDFDALRAICRKRGLVLLEDNCESMGAVHSGRKTGTIGEMGTLSCFFSHHISTMEGGLVLTDSEELAHLVTSLRAHGWTRELPERNHVFNKTGSRFDDLFRFVLPGYNVRPLEMSGAIGCVQLRKLAAFISRRRANAATFTRLFADHPAVGIQREVGQSSWFGFAMVLRDRLAGRRADVVRALEAEGIECRPIVAGNFARNPVMKHLPHTIAGPLVHADYLHENGLFVGNHALHLDQRIERLRAVIDRLAAPTQKARSGRVRSPAATG